MTITEDIRRDPRAATVMVVPVITVTPEAVAPVVIHPRMYHRVTSEVADIPTKDIRVIGDQIRITGENTIEDLRHRMPTPSAPFSRPSSSVSLIVCNVYSASLRLTRV